VLDFHIQVVSITRHLERSPEQHEQLLSETLLWPEITTFGNNLRHVRRHQDALLEDVLKRGDTSEIHERQIPATPELGEILIELRPPHRNASWREPVMLRFYTVRWEHDRAAVIYLPELKIEVIVPADEDSTATVFEHIHTAILRSGHAQSLFNLAVLQRTERMELDTFTLNTYPETSKERWDRSLSEEDKKSELRKVGINLGEARSIPEAFHYGHHVQQLAHMLTGRRAMSVLIVGPPGVGKTAVVMETIARRNQLGLGRHEFWKTSGARIVAGQSGFGDWQARCQKIVEEAKERNAILYFGNLRELLETGRAGGNSESIASFFRPRMVRGEVLAILECTPEQLTAIEKRDPRVLDGMRQMKMDEPEPALAFEILRTVAQSRIKTDWLPAHEDALRRIDSLHRRYVGYSAYPGKPLRFMERLFFNHEPGTALSVARVNGVFSAETGLPLSLLEDSIPLDLAATKAWFQERLMGQDRAVGFVVDTIAMIKARLSRPGKPLGSFLFVGPTGVGKTELAKCLAEFFYGNRDRMIRLDMSEYHAPGSASRLVSNQSEENEGILTAQLRDQPFSVLLLDEFEKANSAVFDMFLQVLGEARLTDGAGRVADFSNAIVIMTSNLGAQSYRAGATLGFSSGDDSALGAEQHFTIEAKQAFRPEFFNRIDRIVPFLPLDRATLERIVEKELADIHRRDGLRERQLSLQLSPTAMTEVMQHGFDPRYGARPLRRELDQRILRRVAQELNEAPGRERGSISLTRSKLKFTREDGEKGERTLKNDVLSSVSHLRRRYQQLRKAAFVSELNSELYRLDRRLEFHRKAPEPDEEIKPVYARKNQIDELLARLNRESDRVVMTEESLLLETLGRGQAPDLNALPAQSDFRSLLVSLYAASEQAPEQAVLVFQGEDRGLMFSLASDYREVGERFGCQARVSAFMKKPREEELDTATNSVRSQPVSDPDAFFKEEPAEVAAVAEELRGSYAYLRFSGESGGHEFEGEDKEGKFRARVSIVLFEEPLETVALSVENLLRPELKHLAIHRYYSTTRNAWRDTNFGVQGNEKYSVNLLEYVIYERLVSLAERAL